MSAAVEDQVALAVLTQLNRAPPIGRLATRLRWLLEWESAYLAEQLRLAPRQSTAAEPEQAPSPPERQRVEHGQAHTRAHSPGQSHPKPAETGLPGEQLAPSPAGSASIRSHSMPQVPAAEWHPSRAASTIGQSPRSQPPAATHALRQAATLQPHDANAVRVEWTNGGIRLLIRAPDLHSRAALSVTARIRSTLAGSGVRLTDVFLNGELLWSENEDARKAAVQPSQGRGFEIDEVY
jgi:hypothetical protein